MPASKENVVASFISAKLAELYPTSSAKKKAPGEYTLEQIADDLGVTKPQVASALKGPRGIGPKFERQFALKHFGGSIDRLRQAALRWAELSMPKTEPVTRAFEAAAEQLAEVRTLLLKAETKGSPESAKKLREAIASLLEELPSATPARGRAKPRA